MFKSSISSYLFPQWFTKKSTVTTPSTPEVDAQAIPRNFTISNQDNKLINVSMNNEEDEFVDIQTKPLSYAEVASFGKNKKQTALAKPAATRVEKNQFNVLKKEDEDEAAAGRDSLEIAGPEDVAYEPFKSGDEYDRNMSYKNKQSKAIIKKKKLNRELKNKQKS
ncbi:hypothetical protein Cantr_10472 [Candida viswanathii]|uniref:Uncharacterized protein n=1 Tax=Candida viswanathii TaxID=5486 RepID=A0A367YEJ9_9ASCO|nr:hypothetical protein Cantr_10472 [Candida viswanathii]